MMYYKETIKTLFGEEIQITKVVSDNFIEYFPWDEKNPNTAELEKWLSEGNELRDISELNQ